VNHTNKKTIGNFTVKYSFISNKLLWESATTEAKFFCHKCGTISRTARTARNSRNSKHFKKCLLFLPVCKYGCTYKVKQSAILKNNNRQFYVSLIQPTEELHNKPRKCFLISTDITNEASRPRLKQSRDKSKCKISKDKISKICSSFLRIGPIITCAKFCENRTKTVRVIVIWKKFDNTQTDISYLYCKLCWLQACSSAKNKSKIN